ncbi:MULTISPECIES: hypothetical protein [Actinomycetes]|uniref:hypothetical protein n=1 Tax=Actinomycetes TaxID=1760 RepID=UPI0023306EF9|nr:hypothetical protein [Pseudoclavibacter terrae]
MHTNQDTALTTRSLRERVESRLTHLDLGSYDFAWLDSRNVEKITGELRWLEDAAAECRVEAAAGDASQFEGYAETLIASAEAYEEVLEVVQIESHLR